MQITDKDIEQAKTTNVQDPVVKGHVTDDDIEKARLLSLGTDPNILGGSYVDNVDPSKYDFQRRTYADNDELRANKFSSVKSFGAGLGKLLSNTTFDILSGASNVLVGIPSAIANGDANQIFDNSISQALTDAQDYMNEEIFPIYNTIKDQDKNILQRAFSDLEFWTDDILGEGVPFVLSAWLTAYAGASALGPLTKAKYLKSIQAARGLGAEAVSGINKSLSTAEQITAAFTARTVEGLVEAKDTRDMVYNKLISQGKSPDEAASEAGKAAMTTFGLNYLLLPIEYIQAGSWFRTFKGSRDALLKATKNGFELPKKYTLNRVGKEIGINAITEGPIEENYQKALQDYVYEQYTGRNEQYSPWEEEIRDGISGIYSKMLDNFTTKEGWDAIGTGSILGGLFGGTAAWIGAKSKQERQRAKETKADLEIFNNNKEQVDQRIENIVDNIRGYEALDKLAQSQLLQGNESQWNVTETLKFAEYAFAHFEAGLGARLEEQVTNAENLSEEDFLSGYKDKNKVQELKQKAARYEDLHNMITNRFRTPNTKEGRKVRQALFREAILQEELGKEIQKIAPKVEALEQQLNKTSGFRSLVASKSKLAKLNKNFERTIKDIQESEDTEWKNTFGKKLISKIERNIKRNEKEIKKLTKDIETLKKEDEELSYRRNRVLEDEYKVQSDNLIDLQSALEVSLNRYDALADPETQLATAAILKSVEQVNKKTQEEFKKAKEQAAKEEKATQVAKEIKQPKEKILATKPQKGDTISFTKIDQEGDQDLEGQIEKVDNEGNILSVTANGQEYSIGDISNIVVKSKKDTYSPSEEDSESHESETSNPDQELSDQPNLFEERKKKTNEYSLAGRDINYQLVGDSFIDEYDSAGNLSRNQPDFYNYVNDPDNKLIGEELTLSLETDTTPEESHIKATLPNGLSTSIHTVSFLENGNIAFKELVNNKLQPASESEIKRRIEEYKKWREGVVNKLRKGEEVKITITSKGNGVLLRNQKVGQERGRVKISQHLDPNTTPIGVSIKSKQGEEHVIRFYDWKGAPSSPVREAYDKGVPGRTYVSIPSANGTPTHIPVWSRTLNENEAKLVNHAAIKFLEGSKNEVITGTTWTYNDLLRFYIFPPNKNRVQTGTGTVSSPFDIFIDEKEKIFRIGQNRYTVEDLKNQRAVIELTNKLHQVQNKRLSTNDEIPVFNLVNNELVVSEYMRYREYLFNSVLETDVQPIEVGNKKLFFGQPTIEFSDKPVEPPKEEKQTEDPFKTAMSELDDDIFSAAGFKIVDDIQSYNKVTEKELQWYKDNLNVPVEVVPDLIRIASLGKYAVGMFNKGLITVYENAPEGTLYHEAFHAVFRMMLTESEQKDILSESKLDEEGLANLFEEYMLSDGLIKVKPKAKNFFERLWNLIKNFVLGRTSVEEVFEKIRTGKYNNFNFDPSRSPSIALKEYNFTPQEEVALMNFMTRRLFVNLFKTDFDANNIEELNITNEDIVKAYNEIQSVFKKVAEEDTPYKHQYNHAVTKFDKLMQAHQVWMSKYKISIPDLEFNEEEESVKLKDMFQYKEPTEFSAKDNAKFMVKLFVASLPKMTIENGEKVAHKSELRLPSVTNYNETWNFLLEKLSGSIPSVDEFTKILKKYTDVKPELDIIIDILNKPGTLSQELFVTQFLQSFSTFNTKPVTNYMEIRKSGGINAYEVNSDIDNLPALLKRQWQSNLLNSKYIEVDPLSREGNYITKNTEIEQDAKKSLEAIKGNDISKAINELSKFGFQFTPGAVEAWSKTNDPGKFLASARYILSRLSNPATKNKLDIFTSVDEIGNVNLLAEIEAEFNTSIIEAVHLNPENKPTYHYIQHHFLSLLLNDINNGRLGYMQSILNSYSGANSKWVQAIKNGLRPEMVLIEGARIEGFEGAVTTELSPEIWITTRINNILQDKPIFPILRAAEKKSEFGLKGFELVKSGVVRNNSNKGLKAIDIVNQSLIDQVYGYFEDEYKRAAYIDLKHKKRAGELIPEGLLTYLGITEDQIDTSIISPIDTRGREMTFFGRIFNDELRLDLLNFHKPTDSEKTQIRSAIKQFIVEEINRTFAYLNDNQVIRVLNKGNYVTSRTQSYAEIIEKGTIKDVQNVTIGVKQLDKYVKDPFLAISDFAVNELISTFELIKLTMGDVAYYKDFFKRTPLVTGTGKVPRIDTRIANYINAEYSKLRAKYPNTKSKEEIISGELKLAVVKSPIKKSKQLPELRKQLKSLGLSQDEIIEMTKDYEAYDESDAFSWITPQAAREFLIRIGDWNSNLESIYDNIVNLRPVPYKKLKYFMTAMKIMGAGPIKTQDSHLNPIAYLKTAVLPIIPRAVKGRMLEKQLERMYKSGTDMLIVDSGSKGASYEMGEFYSEDLLTNGSINQKYLKLQIDVQQQSKNKVIFGTQLRKLMFSYLFDYDTQGRLIQRTFDVDGEKLSSSELWERFNEKFDKLTELHRSNILNELGIELTPGPNGIEDATYKIVDYPKIVEKLRNEAEKRFYPKNYIEAIKLNEEGVLDIPGDSLANRRSLENLLNALIFSTVVRQKAPGVTAVQVPVTGFETSDTEITQDSTGELKFISYDSASGKVLEAEIYLPHNFMYKGRYLNELKIEDVDEKALEFVGFRIPTEGLRSVLKLKVKGFLPREMGDIVIVPSELVAQAGSDFDIDKLLLLQPHYEVVDNKVIKVSSKGDSQQNLENYILDITRALLSHKDAFIPSVRTTSSTVDKLKKLASDIRTLKEDQAKEDNPLSIISFKDKMEIAYKFIAGKSGVGVAALHNTHHVLTQYAKISLTPEATSLINFKHNKSDGKASLHGKLDSKGRSIFDITAASVNGFVDIVKNPFIIDLFTNLNTASVALTMIRLGGDVNWVAKFINQPIIQRFIKSSEFAKSDIGKILDQNQFNVLRSLRNHYYNSLSDTAKEHIDKSNWTLTTPIFKNITEKSLENYMSVAYTNGLVDDSISNISNNALGIPTDEYYLSQLSILADFLNYSEISNKLFILNAMSNSDTFRGKTFNDVDKYVNRKQQQYIDESEEGMTKWFDNYQNIFNNTFIESLYRNGAAVAHKAFREIFPVRQSDLVQDAVRNISALVGRSNKLKDSDIEKISDSLMGYIMYQAISKDEIREFVLDQYLTPEERLLASPRIKSNLASGKLTRFIKFNNIYKVNQKINLNGVYSLVIKKVTKTTPTKVTGNDIDMLGVKFFKPNQEIYVYDVAVVKNKLVKESGIRRLHNLIQTGPQELKDNLLIKNLRTQFSRKANGINVLKFRVRPSDNVVHEDLVDSWRALFNSADPELRKIALDIAKYAIYQSGMRQSNISFFKYIPPEEFSKLINKPLSEFNQELNTPEVIGTIFRNLWGRGPFVPAIKRDSQLSAITDQKNEIVGYILNRKSGANANFYKKGVPPFLKYAPQQDIFDFLFGGKKIEYTLLELVGFTGEKQQGSAVYQITSKLGDGVALSEYHGGPSVYEDNNEYIEDNSAITDLIKSSPNYWEASTPLRETTVESSVGYDSDSYSGIEEESSDQGVDLDMFSDPDYLTGLTSFFEDKFQLSNEDLRPPDKDLDLKLKFALAQIGVQVNEVDRIITKFGTAIAVTKILDRSIDIAKGKADITTLPEEAAHIFVAMLGKDNPLIQKMMREIIFYPVYKRVKQEYSEEYNGDEERLRLEAIGKLIGEIIVNEHGAKEKAWWERLWSVVKRLLQRLNILDLKQYTTNNPAIFKQFALDILNKRPTKQFPQAIVENNFEDIVFSLQSHNYIKKNCE